MAVKVTGILADPTGTRAALQIALLRALTPEAERVAEEVRAAAPSRSGDLRASLNGEVVETREGVKIAVASSLEYAGVVEAKTPFAEPAFDAESDAMTAAIAAAVSQHVEALNKGTGDKP